MIQQIERQRVEFFDKEKRVWSLINRIGELTVAKTQDNTVHLFVEALGSFVIALPKTPEKVSNIEFKLHRGDPLLRVNLLPLINYSQELNFAIKTIEDIFLKGRLMRLRQDIDNGRKPNMSTYQK